MKGGGGGQISNTVIEPRFFWFPEVVVGIEGGAGGPRGSPSGVCSPRILRLQFSINNKRQKKL